MTTLGSREGHPLNAGSLSAAIVVIAALTAAGSALAAGPSPGVSTQEWAAIEAQIEVERHKVVASDRPGRLYRADNPTQRFTAHFGAEDVVIEPIGSGEPAWHLGLRLTSWGAADNLKQVEFAHATAERNRVELRRGPLTEWYLNTSLGLEQGFMIGAPPGDEIDELVLEMTLDGDLTPVLSEGGQGVTFRQEGSNATLTYSGLAAWDVVGESLNARMELTGGGTKLRLVIRVEGAAWPIQVDPIFTQLAKLLPTPDLDTIEANFGRSVALDGDFMVVGIRDVVFGADSGATHVFRRDQGGPGVWGHVAKLTASDGSAYDDFGTSVAINGDTVVIGADGDADNGFRSGSAYVYQRDQGGPDAWGQVAKITPTDGEEGESFGGSVAIHGDTAVIGADLDDDNGFFSGSAYVFQRNQGGTNSWGQVAKITPIDGAALDSFGYSVFINGDTAVIGAPWDSDNGPNSGSSYVFQRDHGGTNSWGQVAKLLPLDGATDQNFGATVCISGDTAIAGANGDEFNGYDSGAAYVFQRDVGGSDAWGQVAKITAEDGAARDSFGTSVAIDGDTAVIGASGDDDNGEGSGAAYVFQRDQGGPDAWGQLTNITSSDGAEGSHFGSSVTVSGDTAVVGAFGHDDDSIDSGSAYGFQRDEGGVSAWGQVTKLPCPPVFTARDENFGGSVSISGDTAIVGAHGDDTYGSWSGSAYLFRSNQGGLGAWGRLAKISAGDGGENDSFGYSTAISGDIAVVGAFNDNVNGFFSGSAYVFQRDHGGPDAWGQVAKLAPSDGANTDYFGLSVSISGDTAVVGAPWNDSLGSNSGSAYVFARNQGGADNWGQVAKLTASDGVANAWFGYSVAIDGDILVVGAVYDTGGIGTSAGAAYVFARNQNGPDAWGQVAKITPADGTTHGHFGCSVAMSGGIAVVGADGDDDNGPQTGSAYVFRRDQGGSDAWLFVAKLAASDGVANDNFGFAVSISGDTIVVGVPNDYDNGVGSGSAYVFRRNQGGPDAWGQVAKINAPDAAAEDDFGCSVSVDAEIAIIGKRYDDDLGENAGTAYLYIISDAFFADGFEAGDTSGWSTTAP